MDFHMLWTASIRHTRCEHFTHEAEHFTRKGEHLTQSSVSQDVANARLTLTFGAANRF